MIMFQGEQIHWFGFEPNSYNSGNEGAIKGVYKIKIQLKYFQSGRKFKQI